MSRRPSGFIDENRLALSVAWIAACGLLGWAGPTLIAWWLA